MTGKLRDSWGQGFCESRVGRRMVIDFPLHLLHLAWQFRWLMPNATANKKGKKKKKKKKNLLRPSPPILCVRQIAHYAPTLLSSVSAALFVCRKKSVSRENIFFCFPRKLLPSQSLIAGRFFFFFPFLFFSSKQEHTLLLFLSHCLSYGLVWDWMSSCRLAPRATRRQHRARAPQIRETKVCCSNEQLGNCFGRCDSWFYPLFGMVGTISLPRLTDCSLRPLWLLNIVSLFFSSPESEFTDFFLFV